MKITTGSGIKFPSPSAPKENVRAEEPVAESKTPADLSVGYDELAKLCGEARVNVQGTANATVDDIEKLREQYSHTSDPRIRREIVTQLKNFLNDTDAKVREAAVKVLIGFCSRFPPEGGFPTQGDGYAGEIILGADGQKLLCDQNAEVRQAVLEYLQNLITASYPIGGKDEARQIMLQNAPKLLHDSDARILNLTFKTIQFIAQENNTQSYTALAILKDFCRDADVKVCDMALKAIGGIASSKSQQSESALEWLSIIAINDQPLVAKKAMATIATLLSSTDSTMLNTVVRTLGGIAKYGSQEVGQIALASIKELLLDGTKPNSVRATAFEALISTADFGHIETWQAACQIIIAYAPAIILGETQPIVVRDAALKALQRVANDGRSPEKEVAAVWLEKFRPSVVIPKG